MYASIFTTIIIKPIFNLLVFIYAILPGHNFGLAIIIFTVLIRLLMWPLVKKQINQAKAMRELAPEIKKIKAAAKGDRQKESQMTMELYKEREINPFASFGILLVQLPVLLGLYSGLNRIIKNPHQIVTFSYSFIQHLGWIKELSHNIHRFDDSLLGFVNLTRTAVGTKGVYWVGILIAAASALAQYYQSRQLMPQSKDQRGLRQILSEAGQGKTADQSEVNAAVGRSTMYLVPGMVFLFAIRLALALPLYWLASSVVAVIQQARILREDVAEADALADKPRKVKAKVTAKAKPAKPDSASSFTTSGGLKVTRKTLKDSPTPKPKTAPSRKTKRRKRR
ncbi:MAG TPA: YidC/Oxa1 family membrane protein insertase [Candidatus Saccharimonadales bacterium]|nr:YidC/Oxa1 family membrane protein insertase [Candidatus Saccharimonadales bacterium]